MCDNHIDERAHRMPRPLMCTVIIIIFMRLYSIGLQFAIRLLELLIVYNRFTYEVDARELRRHRGYMMG